MYVRKPTEAELAAGEVPLTQFGRMCATLNLRIIAAHSPQAKGRVERGNGTHQDRLIKKLRRRRVGDYLAANAYLDAEYLGATTRGLPGSPPRRTTSTRRSRPGWTSIRCFGWKRWTLTNDWVVRYENRFFQVARQGRTYPPAQSTVRVCEYEDGHLEVWYRGAPSPTARSWRPARCPRQRRRCPRASSRAHAHRPAADHPWHRPFRALPDRVPWRGASRRAVEMPAGGTRPSRRGTLALRATVPHSHQPLIVNLRTEDISNGERLRTLLTSVDRLRRSLDTGPRAS